MAIRRVLGAGQALLGGLGVVIAVVGLFRGELALAPFGVLGLLLLGVGSKMLLTAAGPPGLAPGGGYRYESSAGGPIRPYGMRYRGGYDEDRTAPSADVGDGGGWSGSDGGAGWSGGGWSDGGGSSGGGDGGGGS